MNRYYSIILIGLISCTGKIDPKETIPESKLNKQEEIEFAKQQYLDTLFAVTGLQNLKSIVKKEENQKLELIRLVRTTSFGINEIIIIDLERNGKVVNQSSYKLKFNRNCNTPLIGFDGGKKFSTDCFETLDSYKESTGIENWNSIKSLIWDTDLLDISYVESRGRTICDGSSYLIQYAYPFHWRTEIISLQKSCPGRKSAVYLVGEELIKLTKLN